MATAKNFLIFTVMVMLALIVGHFLFGKVLAKAPIVGGVAEKFDELTQGE